MATSLILPGHPFELFKNFVYAKWKWLNLPDPTPVQYDIADFMQHGPERSGIEAYRGVGKSYLASSYSEWRWLKDPDVRIQVVSGGKDRADAFSQFCLRCLTDWDVLSVLTPRKDQRKALHAFDVNGARADHSPSCKSVGITGQLTGTRADVIIPDDVETPKNSLTVDQREKLERLVTEFDAILKPIAQSPERKVLYLGTPQIEDSLYHKLREKGYEFRVWPARKPSMIQVPERYGSSLAPYIMDLQIPEGAPVDPLRFTEADLVERELSYGRTGFALQFMLDTSLEDELKYPLKCSDFVVMDVDREIAPIKVSWASGPDQLIEGLSCGGLKGDRWFGPMYVSPDHDEYQGSVMMIDPAGRGKDRTGYAVVKQLNGMLFARRVGGLEGGYEEKSLRTLAHIARAEKVDKVVVESNFGDGMFLQLLKPVLSSIYPCATEERSVHGQKELRIIDTLEPLLNQHRIVIDRKIIQTDATEDVKHSFVYQLTRITKDRNALGHDDALDAFEGACAYWVERLDISLDDAEERHKEDKLNKELDKWMEEVTGSKRGSPNWTSTV